MAKLIVDKLFDTNKKFQREDFLEFVSDITGKYPNNIRKSKSIDNEGNEYFKDDICIYEDEDKNKIAIIVYKMPSASKVERARSYQRNLISSYLKDTGVYDGINSVLCAFYSDDSADWRLSFIKQEFKLKDNEFYANGKRKLVSELTPAKRYSFLVESNSKNVTVKQRLDSLLENKDILVSDIEKAFSVEKVSKEFFDKYVKLYEKLVDAFKEDKIFLKIESESNHGDENFRENFVKKLLGQIVFLYFLQKKGWLGVKKDGKWGDGNKNFLQDLLRECLVGGDVKKELGGKNFFNDYLEHLFYAFLNTKEIDRKNPDYFNCRIPYLNGGLFEPMNDYDWISQTSILLSGEKNNLLFKEIFDTFDEYNFTVYENDPLEQDVAVDPEMLGKVFENLLPENERKGKGAFYTPREIVHYMCKESLKNYIINKTGISEKKINGLFERKDSMYNSIGKKLSEEERYIQFGDFIEYAENIVESLKTVKIVDPAVGSGAFPMGLLKEIVSLRKYLQENILLEDNVSEYQIKKETLENCIYGVDLDPGAVEIAKLRFWLSLVIEEDSKDNIDPLPNLDYKIMQGNSLIEDIVVGDSVIKIDLENNTKKLTKKEEKEFSSISQGTMSLFADEVARDDILKRLKFLHKIFFQEKDNIKKKSLKTEIDHIEKELIRISGEVEVNRIKSQIDNIEGKYIISGFSWDEKDAKKVAEFYSQISSIKEMEEKYKRDNVRSFFPWKLHFGEVFNENGGFDIVIGNPPYVSVRTKEFGNDGKTFFKNNYILAQGQYDLYTLFIEKSNNLVNKSGILGFIIPNNLISNQNFEIVRKFLNNNLPLLYYIDTEMPFETANVESNVIICKKDYINNQVKNYKYKNNEFIFIESININQYDIFPFNIWPLIISNSIRNLLLKVSLKSDSNLGKIASINRGMECGFNNKYISKIKTNYKVIKGEHIKKYFIKSTDYFVKPDFSDKKIFKNKDIYLNTPKLLTKFVSNNLDFAYDNEGIFNTNVVYNIHTKDNIKFLLGYLNSKLISFWFRKIYLNDDKVFPHIQKNQLESVPIKKISQEAQKPFIDLVDQILEITKKEDYLDREDLQKHVKVLESRIDDMVYKLYELTPEEIELVKDSLK